MKSNPKMYFTNEVDKAIHEYNNESNPLVRSKIYEEKIHYAFFKLTQNIIHTFKFYNTDVENLEDLQHEIIVFLLSKLHRFNPNLGHKAFSYFGTITKNWLIAYDRVNYKKKINNIPIELLDFDYTNEKQLNLSPTEQDKIEDDDGLFKQSISQKQDKLEIFLNKFIEYYSNHLEYIFSNEDDIKIADAIFELFRRKDSIVFFNKKALYINIREYIDIKTPRITRVAKFIHKIFKDQYAKHLDNDLYNFEIDPYLL